jgi:carbamoyltransferase
LPAATLVLAGGVAMNCSMIGRLIRSGVFDHVYVPPVPTDAGVSLGGALVEAARHSLFTPTLMDHAYWGVDITAEQAAAAAGAAGLVFTRVSDDVLARTVAAAVAGGKVAGWARGRGEIGQRALGARSIVADPRDRRNLARLNLMKGREMWRPVAPSVLAERVGELMAAPPGHPGRFMLSAGAVRAEARTRIPATTHVDGSARPQLVERSANPVYWEMIDRFRRLTGIPAVVNTSFNLAGEPIVATAADAVSTFTRSELDLLVLGNLLVARNEADLAAVEAAGAAGD